MILKFSYKQKLKILPLLFLGGVILVYWMAISGTVLLKKSCKELTMQMISAGDASKQMDFLTRRLGELSKLAGNIDTEVGTDPLLNFVSINLQSSSKLINYLPLHYFKTKQYLIETRVAVFEGNYMSLLEFLFTLEKSFSFGKVVSVKFETESNIKTNKKRLLMTLYIQSITNEKNTTVNYQKTAGS